MKTAFLHGLDSSPGGTKAVLLKRRYPDIIVPSLPPDLNERLNIIENVFDAPLLLIGSSLGGLTAIMYAMKHPAGVRAMVLMAPAVGSRCRDIPGSREEGLLESLHIPETVPAVIVAGLRDELIPVSAIRGLIHRSPCQEAIHLHEVDDDHNLHGSLDLMLQSIDAFKRRFSE